MFLMFCFSVNFVSNINVFYFIDFFILLIFNWQIIALQRVSAVQLRDSDIHMFTYILSLEPSCPPHSILSL